MVGLEIQSGRGMYVVYNDAWQQKQLVTDMVVSPAGTWMNLSVMGW
jgi:hypothetical protein